MLKKDFKKCLVKEKRQFYKYCYTFCTFKQAYCLVCSVGSNLNLSIGAIARSMSHAAGPTLQEALLKETNNLSPGEVVHTSSPGKLPCKHVVFCVCCPWDKGQFDAETVR